MGLLARDTPVIRGTVTSFEGEELDIELIINGHLLNHDYVVKPP